MEPITRQFYLTFQPTIDEDLKEAMLGLHALTGWKTEKPKKDVDATKHLTECLDVSPVKK